jgi:hypothetical protein
MTSKELFRTLLRGFGVWILLRMLDYWIEAFDISAGLFKPLHDTMGMCFTHTVAYFVIGIYLLRGAPHVVEFAFRERRKNTEDPNSEHDANT